MPTRPRLLQLDDRACPAVVALPDAYSVRAGQTLTVPAAGVLTNDTADAPPLAAAVVEPVPADAGTLALDPDGAFTFTPAAGFVGTTTFVYSATEGGGASAEATVTITVSPPPVVTRLTAQGSGAGGGPRVVVRNQDGSVRFDFFAFEPTFLGGVRVAVGDTTGDGVPDIVCAAGPGGGPAVKVFDGTTGAEVASYFAFEPGVSAGVYVAVGDLTGDGRADIVTGAGSLAGPRVRVVDGATLATVRDFFAYDPAFLGGVRVAAADLNGDGIADLVTVPGPSGGPEVRLFNGAIDSADPAGTFMAFEETYRGGAFVAAYPGGVVVGRDGYPNFAGTLLAADFANLPPATGGATLDPEAPVEEGATPSAAVLAQPTTAQAFRVSDFMAAAVGAAVVPFGAGYAAGGRVAADGNGGAVVLIGSGPDIAPPVGVWATSDIGLVLGGELPAIDPGFGGGTYVAVGSATFPVPVVETRAADAPI